MRTVRKLRLRFRKDARGEVYGKVVEQTHRGRYFTSEGETFRPLSGSSILLSSVKRPEVWGFTLFVRGSDKEADRDLFYPPTKAWRKDLMATVREYNQEYGTKRR